MSHQDEHGIHPATPSSHNGKRLYCVFFLISKGLIMTGRDAMQCLVIASILLNRCRLEPSQRVSIYPIRTTFAAHFVQCKLITQTLWQAVNGVHVGTDSNIFLIQVTEFSIHEVSHRCYILK